MRAAVITFPASNCDRDVAAVLERITGRRPAMIWHQETDLPDLDLIVLPGGFSFGDYLRPGAMAAHSPIMREVARRAEAGVLVLGICNGFQILTEAHLLPGALLPNATLNFACKDVFLRVESAESPFTRAYRPGQVVRFPIAHHEGNYFADAETLARVIGEGEVAFRYAAPDGAVTAEANPNGSAHNIAGLFNRRRNVLGLMPHPERLADPLLGGTDGRALFESLVREMA